ncbi:MAG: hypothetical protein AAGF31_13190, partial [Planctomycetota bacterium]
MIPFRVQCETCQSRLRVNDPSVVGQVHGCPKCGSMVHLVPPAVASGAAADNVTTSESTTRLASAPADSIDPSTASATPDFGEVGELGTLLDNPAPAANDPAEGVEASSSSPFVVAPAEATGRWIGLAVAGVGGSLFLVAGLVFYATRGGDPAPQASQVTAAGTQKEAPREEPIAKPEQVATPAEPEGDEGSSVEDALPPLAEFGAQVPDVDEPLPPIAQPEDAATPEELTPATTPPPVTVNVETDSSSDPNPPVTPTPSPFDPLDFDPASLDLILTRGPRAEPAPA